MKKGNIFKSIVMYLLTFLFIIDIFIFSGADELRIPKQSKITLLYREGGDIGGLVIYSIKQIDSDIQVFTAAIQIIENSKALKEWFDSGQVGERPPDYVYNISAFNEDKMSLDNFTNLWAELNRLNFSEQEDVSTISDEISTVDGPAFLNIMFVDKTLKTNEKNIYARYFPIMLRRSADPSLALFYTVYDASEDTIEGYGSSPSEIEQRSFLEHILSLKAGPSFEKTVVETIEQLNLPILTELKITPETLNLTAGEGVLTAHFQAPKGYTLDDINTGSLILNGAHPQEVTIEEEKMVARFKREDLTNIQPGEKVKFILNGELIDGTKFGGIDTIRVIKE